MAFLCIEETVKWWEDVGTAREFYRNLSSESQVNTVRSIMSTSG
jgi:hypothetical protein